MPGNQQPNNAAYMQSQYAQNTEHSHNNAQQNGGGSWYHSLLGGDDQK